MHLIAVDIGNSSTKIAWELAGDSVLKTAAVIRGNESVSANLDSVEFPSESAFWAVSSVNPDRLERLMAWISGNRSQDELHIIAPGDIPLESNVESRTVLGRDRLIAAWMAVELNGRTGPVIVVDAGTAVTIDWVDDQLVFQGGFIFPGADLNFRQLSENAAALPCLTRELRVQLMGSVRAVETEESSNPNYLALDTDPHLGRSTTTAILQGIYQSQIAAITTIVNRLIATQSEPVSVFLTGGGVAEIIEFSHAFPSSFPSAWHHVPDLVLRGAGTFGHSAIH